jgi:hypothetical protein
LSEARRKAKEVAGNIKGLADAPEEMDVQGKEVQDE